LEKYEKKPALHNETYKYYEETFEITGGAVLLLTMALHPSPGSSSSTGDRSPTPPPREREGIETIDEATDEVAFSDDAPAGGNESDDDNSVGATPIDDTLEGTEDSIDTQLLITTDWTVGIVATTEKCCVILSAKTPEVQALFCGNAADSCTRRTHHKKQMAETRRAPPGIYEGVLNASK
jgi:hypothetical protein